VKAARTMDAEDAIPGFSSVSSKNDGKNKEKKSKGGGFQSMGLNRDVLKGILKRGYKVPTPIQRKVGLSVNFPLNLF
jgi:ATP-dependent RNA helicase DDX54/DBP10